MRNYSHSLSLQPSGLFHTAIPLAMSRSRSHPIPFHPIPATLHATDARFSDSVVHGPWSYGMEMGSDPRLWILVSRTALLPVETISLKFVRIIMGNFQRTCVPMNISLLPAFKVSIPISSFSCPTATSFPSSHCNLAIFLTVRRSLWLGSSG